MNKANKPLTMVIKETRTNFINVCNESGLSPAILDLILQGIYSEIHSLAEKQTAEEERVYLESIKKDEVADDSLALGDIDK